MIRTFEAWESNRKRLNFDEGGVRGTEITDIDFQDTPYFAKFVELLKKLKIVSPLDNSVMEVGTTRMFDSSTKVHIELVEPSEDVEQEYIHYEYVWDLFRQAPTCRARSVEENFWMGSREMVDMVYGPMSPLEFLEALRIDEAISREDFEIARRTLSPFELGHKYGI